MKKHQTIPPQLYGNQDHTTVLLARILTSAIHDLNNIVVSLIGNTEILQNPDWFTLEQSKSALSALTHAGNVAATQVRQMLDFIRPFENTLERSMLVFSKEEISKFLTIFNETLLSATGIACEMCIDDLPPGRGIVRPLLYLFLSPLLNNAKESLQVLPRKNKVIGVSVCFMPNEDFCVLRVTDNGEGWSDLRRAELQSSIWKSQPSSSKGPERGFGLIGLYRMARAAGGTVVLQSNHSGGAVVEVRLPASVLTYEAQK